MRFAAVPTLQPPGISGSELDTPQPDSFVADCYPTLGQQIFNIAVTEVEPVIEPDGITDDFGWESVSFISIHPPDYRILDVKLSIPARAITSGSSLRFSAYITQLKFFGPGNDHGSINSMEWSKSRVETNRRRKKLSKRSA
jgi:hypothetical protein